MLNVGKIEEGFVLDHIKAGKSLSIYEHLQLDKLDCTVAIIKNARSGKMGKKDILKVECDIDMLDLDVLAFIDHNITSIQDYIDPEILRRYDAVDINVYGANLFHTKMMLKEIDLQNYLFKTDVYELPPQNRLEIMNNLRREMIEIFSGRNIY